MLYSLVLKLKAQNNALISPTQGYHAYALFLNILRQANHDLASRLHNDAGPKPFTLSPLHGRFIRPLTSPTSQHHTSPGATSEQRVQLEAGGSYWLRITILNDEIFSTFLGSLLSQTDDAPLFLEEAALHLEEIITTPRAAPNVDCTTFEAIYKEAKAQRQITLTFLSPTTFRSAGRRNILFPQPALVFGSYLARWNALSPLKLPDSLRNTVENKAILSRYNLRTHIQHFPGYQEVGFEGSANFLIDDRLDEDAVQTLNALADFAFYSGTGAKTTMGMGQTRRRKNARSVSGGAGSDPEKR